MTSINELFPKCRKLAYDARQQLAQVQRGQQHVSELHLSLEALEQQLDVMEQQLVHRETPSQRPVWKRKILELRETARTLRQQGDRLDQRLHASQRYEQEREQLLLRRRRNRNTNNVGENEQDMANLADEAQSWQQSGRMVDELLVTGQASLTGLVDQRQRLRGVNRLVARIGDRLGLTNTTMSIIERRDITDAYLVFALMIVTCIVIYVVWYVF